MVTMETEYGTFTGETEAAALKAARKGKREAAKRDAETAKLREVAYTLAAQKGFRLLCRLLEHGGAMPGGWRIYRPGDKWADSLFATGDDTDLDGYPRGTAFVVESPGEGVSRVLVGHYGHEMLGAVCGGAGFTLCYFLRDRTTGEVECRALGCHMGVAATERVPGVTPEHFRRGDDESNG